MTAPIEIDVWQGEIAELEVDALIVGANESLFMTAGVAASVVRMNAQRVNGHLGEDTRGPSFAVISAP